MKRSMLLLLALLPTAALAGETCQQIGSFTYCNQTPSPSPYPPPLPPLGWGSVAPTPPPTTTCQQIGSFTYCNTPGRASVTCQQIGSFTYCN